ncbi:hypothetical protein WR25_09345 [Diploscapter pachys]|uniref:Phosphatidylinositol transfer protein N-terminal domain-containing protein n=1 Tax=Diploscapter pachys TaxID=2018661 RepID=A0A2A2L5E9_9BILA|nr:hypothetical protein WR25_09345 [Diploscapter pachys]
MCCYKLVSVNFKWSGLQRIAERQIHKAYSRLFTKLNRECVCWMDRWLCMSMSDIEKLEEETKRQLHRQIADPDRKGMAFNEISKFNNPTV